jgi:ligand-binding sensor domain-containing protein
MQLRSLIFFWVLCLRITAIAQDPLLKHFTTSDGLPSSTVYALIQDKDGFIWMGTDAGVGRYDGKRFITYSLSDGLSDNYIISVRSDSKGRIWFMGFNGTVSYWFNGKIFNATTDTLLRNITTTTSFIDLFEDNRQRLWFVSQSEYLVFDYTKVEHLNSDMLITQGFVFNGNNGQIIVNQNATYIGNQSTLEMITQRQRYRTKFNGGYTRLSDGSLLFLSPDGVVKQQDTVQSLVIPFKGEFLNSQQPGLCLSNDSILWMTTTGRGVYCYDLRHPLAKPIVYLENKMTAMVMTDKEGNIWISTLNDGLYMIPEWGRKVTIFNKENGLSDNHCYAINKLRNGELLVGLNNGETEIITRNAITGLKTLVFDKEPNKVHHILSKDDDVWIASDKGLIHLNMKTGCNHFLNYTLTGDTPPKRITSVKDLTLGDHELYVVSGFNILSYPYPCLREDGPMIRYVNDKQTRTYSVYCDFSGELWYGTKSGLNSRKDGKYFDHAVKNELLAKGIHSIAETKDSVLVLATYGYGVLFYKNGKIQNQITTANGLRNNICRRLYIHNNQIYVGTPSGVSVITYTPGAPPSVINMNTGNFLPSNDVNDVYANDSDIYVATMEGAAIIGHWALENIKPDIPMLHLNEVKVNDSIIAIDKKYRFPYRLNSFKFNFIGIYYQIPNDVNYRYKLKDDQPWQFTKNTNLEFSYLAPGYYKFQVQARIQNGEWSPERTYAFSIAPPFWYEPWFILLVMVSMGSLAYFLIKYRVKTLRKRKEEKAMFEKQITQLEQQALQTLMNPHFIFNIMNSIQHFINASDKDAANRYLADFAKLIRMNLNISLKRFIPLEEEINYLQLYLSFEKLRFGDNLTYEIYVDPQIDVGETTIAVMMIQPFIENAIWHGILPMNAKGHIRIRMEKKSDELVMITVEDNGVGIKDVFIDHYSLNEMRESHALGMTMQRLHLLGKSSGHDLHILYRHVHPEKENKGTIAELILPANFD